MLHLKSCFLIQEEDVVFCRQISRQIAGLLGFESVEQTRIATAVSEVARNAYEYANAKDAKVTFAFDADAIPQAFVIEISDSGSGLANLNGIYQGTHQAAVGADAGIAGTRRLMDRFDIEPAPGGAKVVMSKTLPRRKPRLDKAQVESMLAGFRQQELTHPLDELRQQNQELLNTLQELSKRQSELALLNQELAETNRGVVALYAELDERAERLRQADEVKTRFLSHMSHEFRTPVVSVLRLSGFLLDKADGELNSEQEKQVLLIQKSMGELSEMINDLLDLAKVQSGKVTMRIEDFSVADLFGSLRGIFRPLQRNHDVLLEFIPPVGIPRLHTDEGKIAQIMRNFISNALKFTLQGSIQVKALYEATSREVFFTVADTGIGIPEPYRESIFEEFNQIENTLQKQVKGTGLGLPLARKLAQLLGGEIGLEPSSQKGSSFFLRVPLHYPETLADREGNALTLERLSRDSVLLPMSRYALVVGKESGVALKKALSEARWIVFEAETLEEAQGLVSEQSPAALFVDLTHFDLNSTQVLDFLEEMSAYKDMPVIACTIKALAAREEKKLKSLVFDVLPKDMAYEQLLAYIGRVSMHLTERNTA